MRFRFGQVLLATKVPLAPSARAESIGIARPTRPHSFPNERATIIQQEVVFQLHTRNARRAGHAVSLDSALGMPSGHFDPTLLRPNGHVAARQSRGGNCEPKLNRNQSIRQVARADVRFR